MVPTGDKCAQCKGDMYFIGVGDSMFSDEEVEKYRCQQMGHLEESKIIKNKHDHKYENQ